MPKNGIGSIKADRQRRSGEGGATSQVFAGLPKKRETAGRTSPGRPSLYIFYCCWISNSGLPLFAQGRTADGLSNSISALNERGSLGRIVFGNLGTDLVLEGIELVNA